MQLDRGTLVMSLLLAVGAAHAGCKKSYERERREAAEATAQAEKQAREAQQVTITSAEYEPNAEEKANEAEDEALRKQAQAIAALRHEQLDYRARVQKEIDRIDERIGDVRQTIEGVKGKKKSSAEGRGERGSPKEEARASGLHQRREMLRADMDAIDRSTGEDWPTVKARLDKDLKPVGDPTPRSDRPWGEPAKEPTP